MKCLFCKGTGEIKDKQLTGELCPRCAGQVFIQEHQYDDEMKTYQFVCVNCGTIAGGIANKDQDMHKACALFRGNKQDYIKQMKERFNLTVA